MGLHLARGHESIDAFRIHRNHVFGTDGLESKGDEATRKVMQAVNTTSDEHISYL